MKNLRPMAFMALLAATVLVGAASAQTVSLRTVTFSNTVIGSSSGTMTVSLNNDTADPLTIKSISTTGAYSETNNCPVPPNTLGAGDKCKINVTFTPKVLGVQTGLLKILDNGATSPQGSVLIGTGLAPVNLSPDLLGFGNEMLNHTSAGRAITLTNYQTGPLKISSISASTGFAQTSNCPVSPSTLAAGASCEITVTFTPAVLGTQSGTLTIKDNGAGTPQSAQLSGIGSTNPIQNVVLIIQENRTPDNMFQDPNLISAGANIQNYGVNSQGQVIPLAQIDLGTTGTNPDVYDVSHTHSAFEHMCDLNKTTGICTNDGADLEATSCNQLSGKCPPPPNPQFQYVNPADVAPYFQMAETYTFADETFQTNQGPSFPAHQFLFTGTSAPITGSNEFVAEDPSGIVSKNAGCVAPITMYVELINPEGIENGHIYPCLEHSTMGDLLDAADLQWRYYAPNINGIWSAPTAIDHMCEPDLPPPHGEVCTGPDYTANSPKVVLEESASNAQVLTDIANNQLAQVSWVVPPGEASDHAGNNDGCGPAWVTSLVNAIGESPYWQNTAIIITWDDWGGWYDHVPPPQLINNGTSWGSGYVYGFRVPMIVISPYAKAAYISHTTHDFGSILHFIESVYGLPSLGYADAYADDLSDIFQYSQAPLPFTKIQPPSDYATCMSDPTIADPDND